MRAASKRDRKARGRVCIALVLPLAIASATSCYSFGLLFHTPYEVNALLLREFMQGTEVMLQTPLTSPKKERKDKSEMSSFFSHNMLQRQEGNEREKKIEMPSCQFKEFVFLQSDTQRPVSYLCISLHK